MSGPSANSGMISTSSCLYERRGRPNVQGKAALFLHLLHSGNEYPNLHWTTLA